MSIDFYMSSTTFRQFPRRQAWDLLMLQIEFWDEFMTLVLTYISVRKWDVKRGRIADIKGGCMPVLNPPSG